MPTDNRADFGGLCEIAEIRWNIPHLPKYVSFLKWDKSSDLSMNDHISEAVRSRTVGLPMFLCCIQAAYRTPPSEGPRC